MYTTQKVKDICQYLDLNTKIKAISRNSTKQLESFKISLTFLCSVCSSETSFIDVHDFHGNHSLINIPSTLTK